MHTNTTHTHTHNAHATHTGAHTYAHTPFSYTILTNAFNHSSMHAMNRAAVNGVTLQGLKAKTSRTAKEMYDGMVSILKSQHQNNKIDILFRKFYWGGRAFEEVNDLEAEGAFFSPDSVSSRREGRGMGGHSSSSSRQRGGRREEAGAGGRLEMEGEEEEGGNDNPPDSEHAQGGRDDEEEDDDETMDRAQEEARKRKRLENEKRGNGKGPRKGNGKGPKTLRVGGVEYRLTEDGSYRDENGCSLNY